MKRTFNFTGRRPIGRKDVSIALRQEPAAWVFDADLRLADYHFPRNAEIWVEAHRQNLWMQWPWGTISAMRPPADRRLLEFEVPDGVLFRVRVVQPAGLEHHKLLGEADGIPFVKAGEEDDRRQHLLVPVPDALDQQLWKLDFESDPPRLLVNKDAKPSWKEMARSPHFIALVYPEILRRMLARACWRKRDGRRMTRTVAGRRTGYALPRISADWGRCRHPTRNPTVRTGLRKRSARSVGEWKCARLGIERVTRRADGEITSLQS